MRSASSLSESVIGNTKQGYNTYLDNLKAWKALLPTMPPASVDHDEDALVAWVDSILKLVGERAALIKSPIPPVKKVEFLSDQVTALSTMLPILLISQLRIDQQLQDISKKILTR